MLRKIYLIDGYNVLNSIDDLRAVMKSDLGKAREELIRNVIAQTAYEGSEAIIVFDGRAEGVSDRQLYNRGRVEVIFTRKDETADDLIERIVYSMGQEVNMSLVTADYLQQKTVLAKNILRIPPRELWDMVKKTEAEIEEASAALPRKRVLEEEIDEEVKKILEKMRLGEI